MTDHVKDQLFARIEELEAEKLELNEQLDVAQRERGALAAHVEFCHKVLSMIENGPAYLVARQYRALRMARERKPETSLFRLKAKWRAEALEEVAFEWRRDEMSQDDTDCVEYLERKARRIRRQAEGGQP